MRILQACGLLLVALAIAGCGGVNGNTTKVTGVVTVGGTPMEGLTVTFYPEKGRPAVGGTDAAGKFSLTTFAANDGAVVGNHKVAIIKGAASSDTPPPMPGTEGYVEPSATVTDSPFDAKFGNPETSGLTAVVAKGQPNDFKFDLSKSQ